MPIRPKLNIPATPSRRAARFISLALALFCLGAMQPVLAQNFSLANQIDISKLAGNETDPAVAINPNVISNIFVVAVSSATNGLVATYTTNSTTWTAISNIASSTNISTNFTTNLIQAYGEPSVAWDLNSNLFLAYLPSTFQGIAVALSTNGGKTFLAFTNLVPNDVTDQPRIVAGVAGTNIGPNVGSVWLVYKDYSLTGTPLVAQSLQTANILANVPSPIPGSGTNVTDLIGAQSIALGVLGTNVATITSNQMVIGTNIGSPITLSTNTLIVAENTTNLSTNAFITNAGFVTTITPTTNSANTTNCITNYAIHTVTMSNFSSAEPIPGSASGGFPDIAVGPSNEVMVAYQNNINSSNPSKVFVNINTNTLLTNGFGAAVTVTASALGGLTYIPAEEAANGVNAGVGVVWDQSPISPFYGRAYVVYSSGSSPGINIYSSYSVNAGKTWSAAMQVNDDSSGNDHFLPRIALDASTGDVGFCWDDCRNDTGPSSEQIFGPIVNAAMMTTNTYTNIFDLDGSSNDDYMVYGTISTNGGTNVVPNVSMTPIWNMASLVKTNPGPAGGESFSYSSEAALATNANGLGHHIGLAYAAGNLYPVWPDNSDFLAGNPGPPKDFDLYTGYSVLPTATLVIILTESPNPPTSDESIVYTVVLTNYGPFTANNILLTNVLAANVTIDLVRPAAGGSYSISSNGQSIIFSFPPLAPATSLTNTIVITANQSGYATNIASVGSTITDPSPGKTVVTNVVLVNGEDLALGITASPTNVDIGNPVTYTLTVTNLGPAANGLIYITNTFTANLAQVTNVMYQGSPAAPGTYAISNNTIVFSLGTLAPSNTATVSFSATALSLGNTHQYATNTAFVTSTDFDTNLLNNTATAVVTILGEDLAVGLSPSATNVNIGDTITYTLSVTNLGPSDMGDVTLTNTLTSNLGQITLIQLPPQGSGSVSGNIIAFNLDELAAGESFSIIYTAVALSINATDTNAISTALVTSTDFDTNLVNNVASTTVTINGEDLAIGLYASPAPVWDGQPLTYTEIITNLGPSITGVISVTNTLSSNLSSIAVLQAPGSYNINGNTIVFQAGTLGAGQTTTIIFNVTPTSIGVATNSAAMGSTDFDTNLLNNSAQVTTTVIVPPPPITNFQVLAYASSAFILWGTPLPATVQVAYGLTTNYGSITSLSNPSTNHVVLLTGLARNTNYYYNAMSWENRILYSNTGSFATVDTLILNTMDAAYSGPWLEGSPALQGIYGSYFNVANTTQSNPTASATYTPTIAAPGFYNVSTWYPQATNFTTNAQMTVSGATNAIVRSVNQTINGGAWLPLATNLYFASGTGGNVVIRNNTGETNKLVAANAMMWSYIDSQDYPTNAVVPAWWATANIAPANSSYADYVFGLPSGNNPSNTPNLWVSLGAGNTVTVSFAPYQGGRIYELQTATNLANPQWLTLTNQPAIATNASGVFTNGTGYGFFTANISNAIQTYYRLAAQLSTNY